MTQTQLASQFDSPAIETTSFDMSLPVSTFATGWGAALTRAQKIDVVTSDFSCESPKTISFRLGRPAVKTYSYMFPELPEWRTEPTGKKPQSLKKPTPKADCEKSSTRLKPPTDIVKLEDRLYYMLQPPLETILSSESMHMPSPLRPG